MTADDRINAQQHAFVEHYVACMNATEAARRAGYSDASYGRALLTHPYVRNAIAKRQKAAFEEAGVAPERVLQELANVAFANAEDFAKVAEDGGAVLDLSRLDRAQWAAIAEMTSEEYLEGRSEAARPVRRTRIKLANKLKALDALARHYGRFKDRVEMTGEGGGPMRFVVIGEPEAESTDEWAARHRP